MKDASYTRNQIQHTLCVALRTDTVNNNTKTPYTVIWRTVTFTVHIHNVLMAHKLTISINTSTL
jgi:hypothetical protein